MAQSEGCNISPYTFGDLIDVEAFAHLLDSYYKATGIPNGLVSPDGELISQAGWTSACVEFHRAHPETQKRCQQSNIKLMGKLHNGEVAGCMCSNGLLDYATPVVVEGNQLATLFLGQVLNEPADPELFRKQAEAFGFDEEAYLDAIGEVPIISREKLESKMDHLVKVAQVLAESGLARLREHRLQQELDDSAERQIELEDLLNLAPVGIGWSDANGKIEYINHKFTHLFGYTLEDLPDLNAWYERAYPDPEYRSRVVGPWQQAVAKAREAGSRPPELEVNVRCKDGSERRVVIAASWVGNRRLVNFSDITDHWLSELRNRAHDTMLEMVARGSPLSDILHAVVQAVETEEPTSLCSVLLLDLEGKHLLNGAAPSLPDFYNEAINGIEIAMGIGSCGTCAFCRERVIVEDVMTHPYWAPFTELAGRAGLGACWSEPIVASDGKVLGTFAIYHRQPATPSPEDIERITFAANIAAIAIENQYNREELVERERKFRSLGENAPDNIARYDIHGRLIYANPRLEQTLAAPLDKMLGKRPTHHGDDYHFYESQLMHVIESGEEISFELEVSDSSGNKLTHSIRMVAERDETGAITGVLAIGRDISDRKRLELKLESQEREFRTLAENAPVLIARYDCEARLLYCNPKLNNNFPVPIETVIGKRLDEFPELPFTNFFMEKISNIVTSGEATIFETQIPGINGEETHLINMVAERSESGAISGVLTIGQDITERKRMERELAHQAHYDALTGLANRRYFLEQSENEIIRSARYGGELSLLMFDIDHFKQFNDTYGHSVGDRVLQRVAEICSETMRKIDTIGRIGGEEFVILLPQTKLQRAAEVAERLRAAIETGGLQLDDGKRLIFTASFGVVTMTEKDADVDKLLAQSDEAMYQAKEQGRNRVCSYKG